MRFDNRRNVNFRSRKKIISAINVTPMVDLMLVLLIIFMITSPMLVAGIEVDLPKTDSAPISSEQKKPLVVSLDKNGEVYIYETKIEAGKLAEKLNNIAKEKKDVRIFVKGDKDIPYGKIVEVMASIHNSGFIKVALVSEIKDNQ